MPAKAKDPCKLSACKIQACLKGESPKGFNQNCESALRNKLFRYIGHPASIGFLIIVPEDNYASLSFAFPLAENHYQESACLEVLESMRQCCLEHHKVSLCCSGIKLDKPYVKED